MGCAACERTVVVVGPADVLSGHACVRRLQQTHFAKGLSDRVLLRAALMLLAAAPACAVACRCTALPTSNWALCRNASLVQCT